MILFLSPSLSWLLWVGRWVFFLKEGVTFLPRLEIKSTSSLNPTNDKCYLVNFFFVEKNKTNGLKCKQGDDDDDDDGGSGGGGGCSSGHLAGAREGGGGAAVDDEESDVGTKALQQPSEAKHRRDQGL